MSICRKKARPFLHSDEIQQAKAQEFLVQLALAVVELAPLQVWDSKNTAKMENVT